MSLREKILKALAGSSGQNPAYLADLQKLAGATSKGELHALLESLYNTKEVNRCSGMKEGKFYDAYWLTGAAQTCAPPFSITGRPHPLRDQIIRTEPKVQPIAAKVKQKTSTPPKQPKENNVSKPQSAGIGQIMVDIINSHPDGINLNDLIKEVASKIPDAHSKQVLDMTYYLHNSHKIERRGKGKNATMHQCTGASAVAAPAKKETPTAPIEKPASHKPEPQAVKHNPALDCAFRLDGSMTIHKGGNCIDLDRTEALNLMKFATHQLQFASALPA